MNYNNKKLAAAITLIKCEKKLFINNIQIINEKGNTPETYLALFTSYKNMLLNCVVLSSVIEWHIMTARRRCV